MTRLELDAGSPRRARRFAEATLVSWGCSHLGDAVNLLVTEVVTNAILHARTPVDIGMWRTAGGVRVEVRDRSADLPTPVGYGSDAQTGRGLSLVAGHADAWGVTRIAGGKVVWFEVRG